MRRTRVNAGRLTLVIVIAAAVIALCVFLGYMFADIRLDEQKEQELLATGTFREGVSVGGIDVSGLTMEEARVAISPVVNRMLNAGQIEFTVEGEDAPYLYSLEDMGVTVDPTPALEQAMLYGREGRRWTVEYEDPEPYNFQLQRTFNIGEVEMQVRAAEETDEWGEPVVNGNYKVETKKDEDSLTTSGSLVETEPHDGYAIDTDTIISTIEEQIMDDVYTPFEAPVEILRSTSVGEGTATEPTVMGRKTTDFSSSDRNRKYNVWKMSSILNGITVQPGETFSVNDTAGDRNAANGWKEANGIENGQYTPQYGGGICQVSSTLYNACLMAELEIVNRVPHTIAASYVPKGLDATISTGGPDFKFKNTYSDPIYIIIRTDGGDGAITAEIWGHDPRSYSVNIYSEEDVSERRDLPPVEYTRNSSLSANSIQQVRKGQAQTVWNVYKDRVDRDSGDIVESKIYVTKSTYKAIAPLYEVGSGITVPADGTPIGSLGGSVSQPADDGIQADPDSSGSATQKPSSQTTAKPSGGSSGDGGNQQGGSSSTTQAPTAAPPTQPPVTQAPSEPPVSSDGGGQSGDEGSSGEDGGSEVA